MNKVLKIAALLAVAASTSQAEPFWTLQRDGGFLKRGGMDGVWFKYDDSAENGDDGTGGCTTTNFPDAHPTCEDDLVTAKWKGTPGVTYTRVAGCDYKWAFAGIGFTFVTATFPDDGKPCHTNPGEATTYPPQEQAPDKIPAASKDGGGLRVFYKLEGDGEFTLELSTGDGPGVTPNSGITGFNELAVTMEKGDFLESGALFYFEDFAQETGWGTPVTLTEALNAASGFKFKAGMRDSYLAGGLPATATLEIKALEWFDPSTAPVLKVGGAAMANMTQAGRVLSFTGIANSTVEIINLQGALVAREAIGNAANPSINLARLPSGVYMVKVKGQSQSFTQKVMLK